MKKPILAMALALALACGSFSGLLPGKEVMAAEAAAAGTGTVSGGDAETQLEAPANVRWVYGNDASEITDIDQPLYIYAPAFDGDVNLKYEVEFYLNGELYKTKKLSLWQQGFAGILVVRNGEISGWWIPTGEPKTESNLTRAIIGEKEQGVWKFRARAVSADGRSYSEWSDFSWECNNTREAFLEWMEAGGDSSGCPVSADGNGSSDGNESDGNESDDTGSEDDESEDNANDTVTTASGETLISAAAINATASIPAVVRTPQSEVTAAAASAVGGLEEGQYAAAAVKDSQCGELARQAVTNAASSVKGKVAAYLEITLGICDPEVGVIRNVEQLSTPIEFTLAAPEGIDGSQYDFAVVRLHGDGRADILPDLDNDPATITFRTDRFSVYAVIYGDKGAFGGSGKDNVPRTGDRSIPILPFAAAGAACAAAATILRRKAQA